MHTFIKHHDNLFTVGYATNEFKRTNNEIYGWHPIVDCQSIEMAMTFTSYLNGGDCQKIDIKKLEPTQ